MAENIENNGCLQRDRRNTKGMRKRLGHSIGYGKKETVHSRDFWKRYCIKTTLTERIRESRQTRERLELMA